MQTHQQLGVTLALVVVATGATVAAAAAIAGGSGGAGAGKRASGGGGGWLSRLLGARRRAGGGKADPFHGITREEMEAVRERHMFSKLTLFYAEDNDGHEEKEKDASASEAEAGAEAAAPARGALCLIRGEGQYVYDDAGRRYLDCVNNVAHLGHSHPALAAAAARQLGEINTNTRYHHPGRSRYAKKLLALFPPELDVVFFVNSGSEANDLALALARAYTKHEDVVVLDYAYHGHTTTMIDMSPYKHRGSHAPSSNGSSSASSFPRDWVHVVPTPDTYRGKHTGPDAAERYADEVAATVNHATKKRARKMAAYFAEGVLACGGQVTLPPGYLKAVYPVIRQAGGLCVADEVQTGFGRSGSHFWAYETQGVLPDIVTLGKPIANGFPLAAVVTRKEIAESLPLSYFNTYGGSNLAMAMGEATLDTVLAEGLQAKAHALGGYLKAQFSEVLAAKHPLVGDVRGLGMMLGVELVTDRKLKTPAPEAAAHVLRRARDWGVHIQVDGLYENVLKFKPPLAFTKEDADTLVRTIDRALTEWAQIEQQQRAKTKNKQQEPHAAAHGRAAAFSPAPSASSSLA